MPGAARVELSGIVKRFDGLAAVDGVSLRLEAGSVHALLGGNGAGKSTLAKCLLGLHRADAGTVLIDGRAERIDTPADADRLGIGMVHQQFLLAPSLTVAENLVAARRNRPPRIGWRRERAALLEAMAQTGLRVELDTPAGQLSAAGRQRAELLKQWTLRRRVLVLDEPTSVLPPGESEDVLARIRGLARQGRMTMLLITHRLEEALRFADTVTVLRHGRVVATGEARAFSVAALAARMLGESRPAARPDTRRGGGPGAPYLHIRDLHTHVENDRAALDVPKLEVCAGEIVGVIGLAGQGPATLAGVLAGRYAHTGTMRVAGLPYRGTRAQMHALGVRVLPDDPLRHACVPRMSVADNLNLRRFDRDAAGRRRLVLDRAGMSARASALMRTFGVLAPSTDAPITTLSGGTIQRCVVARELEGEVRLLVAHNPGAGLDVHAALQARASIAAAREQGAAVLLISDDPAEILALADRVLVMRNGRVASECVAADTDAPALNAATEGSDAERR